MQESAIWHFLSQGCKQHPPFPKQNKQTVPCTCANSKAEWEFSENLHPEGNLQFEKLGFSCLPVDEKLKCIENAEFVKKKKEFAVALYCIRPQGGHRRPFQRFLFQVPFL